MRVIRGGVVLALGEVLSKAVLFGRNIVLARLISPEDFGIAAALTVTASFLDLVSDLALDRYLVQTDDHDLDRAQGAVHLVMFVRGALAGAVLFALAGPLSRFFEVPQAEWAFQVMGAVPMLKGLMHQRLAVQQRALRYGPSVLADAAGHLVAIGVAAWAALALRDYSAIVYAVIAQFAVTTVASHLLAGQGYRWRLDRQRIRRMSRFGLPLAVNGVMLFLAMQGDRLAVATNYTVTDLGFYTIALNLAMMPSAVLGRTFAGLALPVLGYLQYDRERFESAVHLFCWLLAGVAASMLTMYLLLGDWTVLTLYGDQYRHALPMLPWLAAAFAVRLVREVPTYAAIARGDTITPMLSNMIRLVGLPAMFLAGALQLPLWTLGAAALAAEIVALMAIAAVASAREVVPVRALPAASLMSFAIPLLVIALPLRAAAIGIPTLLTIGTLATSVAMAVPSRLLWIGRSELQSTINHGLRTHEQPNAVPLDA
jgi:O-antigen/teichoic acid export membrane protein